MMLTLAHSRPAVSWAALLKGHFLLRNTLPRVLILRDQFQWAIA
jgi:hypothetical protein